MWFSNHLPSSPSLNLLLSPCQIASKVPVHLGLHLWFPTTNLTWHVFTPSESSFFSMLSKLFFKSLLSLGIFITALLLFRLPPPGVCQVLHHKSYPENCKKQQSTKWERLSVRHSWLSLSWLVNGTAESFGWLLHFISSICLRIDIDWL